VDPLPEVSVLAHFEAQLPGPVADRLLEVKGWSLDTLRWFKAGWTGERVTLPVYDAEGRLLTVLGYLPNGKPKMRALKGRGRHLFPAPELLDTERGTRTSLWLVEGEPDAITARELGIPAVAVPGIGKWDDDWTDRFTGRRVTVCFDCDEACCDAARAGQGLIPGEPQCGACGAPKRRTHGGRDQARKVLDSFRRAGVEARAVDLDPSRSDGFDLSDALVAARAEGRVEDLRKYLARLWYEAWAS
jgi:hypothetical protein